MTVIRRQSKEAELRIRRTSISIESLVSVHAKAKTTSVMRTILSPAETWFGGMSYYDVESANVCQECVK